MLGKCKKCQALEEHNRYLKKVIDSLLKHVGADKVDNTALQDQIPALIADHEGSEDPSETFGEE